MPTKPMDQVLRIHRATKVDLASGCWNWQLSKDRLGYGRLKVSMGSRECFRTESAHRYAFEVFVGQIPDGMNVLHKCDNRSCCNPGHLFLGTQQDNMKDMHAKGRGPKGFKRDAEVCARNARRKSTSIDAAIRAQVDGGIGDA